jgi:hypothetical protein
MQGAGRTEQKQKTGKEERDSRENRKLAGGRN